MRASARISSLLRESRTLLLANLTLGHGFTHFYQASFPLLVPKIMNDLGLIGVEVGALQAARLYTSVSVELPGGFIVDMLKRQWGLIFVGCMGFISVAWLIAGVTPNFPLLVVAVVLISLPGSVWHLPAMAALSQRLPERRGLAISIHGMGGNAGNIVGPLVAGTLLLGLLLLTWRQVALVYAVPPVLIACLFWFSLRGSGRQGTDVTKGLKARLKDARGMFRHPSVRAVVLVAMLRGMGFNTVTFWMPLYLANELGMGDVLVGFHVALLTALGIPALPVMGALSDKLGRRAVLLPGHALMAILVFALVNVGPGLFLTLVIAAMGLFSYSLNQVLRAAVLDLAPKGAEATSYGLIFGSAQLFAAASPLLAGALYDWQGIQAVFYYAATVVALSALVLAIGPTPGRRAPSPARA